MAHPTPDDVVLSAQRRIAERKLYEQSVRVLQNMPWRYAFGGLLIMLLIGLIAWPGVSLHWKLYAAVHGVCAQIHNVALGGVQLPLCARNTGIYSSTLVTLLTLIGLGRSRAARLPSRGILTALGLAIGVLALDGFNSLFADLGWPQLYTPHNWLRTLTGIGAGTALGVLLIFVFNQVLRADAEREQPVVGRWHELAGLSLLNLLVWIAIYANITVAYWPVALLSWSGIVGTLFIALLLPTAVLMGYRRQVRQLTQLAHPATFALLTAVVVLTALAVLRFASEGWPAVSSPW